MARLLCAKNSLTGRQDAGDVISVLPDDHVFGTHEDLSVWIAAGHDAASYPAIFYIVDLPDLSVADAQKYLEVSDTVDANGNPVLLKFRKWGFNILAAERRIGSDGRPVLQTAFKITRKFAGISSLFYLKQ